MTAASPSSLALQGLEFHYGRSATPAVAGIDLDAEAGQMLTLLGPSGCGKTTTLRMVAGLLRPTAGTIRVDGRDITDTPVHARGMGMVFQDYALFPHMSVGQNVGFGLEMRKLPKDARARRIAESLEQVGLSEYIGRSVTELSGGQRQRVALARALAVEPSILLLDEPLSNLDASLRVSLRDEIRTAQLRTGTTALFVTHDQQEALAVSDRIAVLCAGAVEQVGTPDEIYNRPATRFVASFIGRANILDGTLRGVEDATAAVEIPGLGTVRARAHEALLAARAGSEVSLAVHPHRLRLVAADDRGAESGTGRVAASVFTGTTLQHEVELAENTLRLEQLTGAGGALVAPGDRVSIDWDPEDAWVIPA